MVDKETNTSHENLTQTDGGNCCRFMISDKCDTYNSNKKKKKGRSKCCEVENAAISCSTNSINFDNLQLQCMCSSDNNSLEDEDENAQHEPCQHAGSFRERLLNFSSLTKQEDTHLRKRASELVLGTNFENQSVYKNSQSHRISKTFDSCDNIYKPSCKSNHSLSTESDQKSIPYSYLERPTLKLSQSDDKNLRELKIALSTNLSSANTPAIVNSNKSQLTSTHIVAHSAQQSTSTSSTSSKIDKISFSLSTSSTSDVLAKRHSKTSDAVTNVSHHQDVSADHKSEDDIDNKVITSTCENNNKNAMSNVNTSNNNNNNVNNGNNGNGSRKRKGAEGKLAIDLNDRSKYTEEVSV